MAARRAERLVNLVICLLSTRQFITAEHIRNAVPGYESGESGAKADEAFKRMFERDKAELRDLGVPLETGRRSAFDVDDGYRISRRDYELPPVELDPAEAAAVGLAARLWQSATLGAPARTALIKLRAGGADVDPNAPAGASPHIDSSDPALPSLLEASRSARAVRFDYLKSGDADPQRRTVEPWGVLSWRGRWYVVGQDRDRGEARSFRLSRVVGAVEPDRTAGRVHPAGGHPAHRLRQHPAGRDDQAGPYPRQRHRRRRAAADRPLRDRRSAGDRVQRGRAVGPSRRRIAGATRLSWIRPT